MAKPKSSIVSGIELVGLLGLLTGVVYSLAPTVTQRIYWFRKKATDADFDIPPDRVLH